MINSLLARIATLFVMAAATQISLAAIQDPVAVPDFTKGGKIPADSKHDWNLGPTGLRGWMFCDRLVTTDARQILVTQVDEGSPAEGKFQVGDVILGVEGKPFSFDPRTELGRAITNAESNKGKGKLALTRWRAGKSDEVVIKLGVFGSYGAKAPFDCQKSKRLLDQGWKALAARMTRPGYDQMDPIPRSLNALEANQRGQDSLFDSSASKWIWGRPRGRIDDSSPSLFAVASTQTASPNGQPR